LESINEEQLRHNDGGPLKIHGLPGIVVKVIEFQHGRLNQLCYMGENPLEVGEERRIVECPFRCLLVVPLGDGESVGDGKPVPVDLEIGGFTASARVSEIFDRNRRDLREVSLGREEKHFERRRDDGALRQRRIDLGHGGISVSQLEKLNDRGEASDRCSHGSRAKTPQWGRREKRAIEQVVSRDCNALGEM
jgi:hypothetical protein